MNGRNGTKRKHQRDIYKVHWHHKWTCLSWKTYSRWWISQENSKESPSRWTLESQSHSHPRIQRFHKIQSGRAGWFPYDSRIGLGNSGQFLKQGFGFDSNWSGRVRMWWRGGCNVGTKIQEIFRNNKYSNQRNNKERKTANSKSNLECHKCGSNDHFIKDCPIWKNEKGKGN